MSVLSAGSSYYYLTLFVSFAIKRDTKQRSKIKGEIIVNVYINNKTVAESNDIYKRKVKTFGLTDITIVIKRK